MRKLFFIFVSVSLLSVSYKSNCLAQNTTLLSVQDISNLPKEVLFEGKLIDALKWRDKEGEHVIISSETGAFVNANFEHENDGQDAQLFAYHYLLSLGSVALQWKVADFIKDCPVDMEARFISNTLKVTDLNGNGIWEVWMMYVTACHGDVSPLEMKIIMYEGQQKYAMRGQNRIKMSPKTFIGGDYKFDTAFNQGISLFRTFAKKMWQQHISGK